MIVSQVNVFEPSKSYHNIWSCLANYRLYARLYVHFLFARMCLVNNIFMEHALSHSDHAEVTIKLSLPSQLGYEKLVWYLIAWCGPRLRLGASRIADLQTAICEACINAIEHGNQAQPQLRVEVTLHIAASYIEAVVRDEGVVKFCPSNVSPASIEQKLAGLAPARGMGLLLIAQLVDEAAFVENEAGTGNCFRIRMHRVEDTVAASPVTAA
ncbi:MAG: ATP-binding protein [Chloroflexota bacterium]|nr:ATP-binding protein [Chloroflexota bacterium]PLS78592.1 MAG: hypothetical protein CYG59_17550 [Chloroflexota bacterium]